MNKERKTGWATITHKDGSSVTGEIVGWYENQFDINVFNDSLTFLSEDTTITYIGPPMPELPTKPGSVIETGNGMRFFLSRRALYPWTSSISIDTAYVHDEKSVFAYCRNHGDFTVIAEGE